MSRRKDLMPHIQQALDGLKDFQRETVNTVYKQLFEKVQRCMLVADEVGLGKTIVAKGIIARLLDERIEQRKRSPLRVTYICSNQVIAQENIRKLNLFPSTVYMKPSVPRIAYLARDEEDSYNGNGKEHQNLLELNTLTPATSFEVQQSAGIKRERAIIYALLCRDRKMQNRSNGLKWLLRGSVVKMKSYKAYLDRAYERTYRKDLHQRFIQQIKREKLPRGKYELVYQHLGTGRQLSLYEVVVAYADLLKGRGVKHIEKRMHRGCLSLIYQLRRILIHCCLKYVNADLYILDEFQRFRDLIDLDSEEERAVIARKVLRGNQARVLLLSATPFKAFTDHDDVNRGEDHYRDFRSLLRFLLDDNEDVLQQYDQHRQALYRQLLDLRKGETDVHSNHRDAVQQILRRVMCRTERVSVANDPAIMIEDQWQEPVAVSTGDIENFRRTDQLVQALNRLDLRAGKPVEYCKSAIFPFSYLDRYKLKQLLDENKQKREIKACLNANRDAWLDIDKIDRYERVVGSNGAGPSHAKVTQLIDKSIGERGAELLWVPPSLPYYPLAGSFRGQERFSKTLLFSAWVMVPRVIGTLLSYEVERRTIGSEGTGEANEKQERRYFTADDKRHPVPQLRFTREGRDREARLRNMSNFCLLYPSLTLANIVDPVKNIQDGLTLEQLREKTVKLLKQKLDEANLDQYRSPGGDSERWYWAAPLLLDKQNDSLKATLDEWFCENGPRQEPWGRSTYFRGAAKKASAKEQHFAHLRECYEDTEKAGLGHVPDDLAEVLADLALGSPAVLTQRSLRRIFPDQAEENLMVGAFDASDEFVNLFNKPESITAVRLRTSGKSYWRKVVRYCAAGCLQAVLDEYFHVLRGQNVDAHAAIKQLLSSVNLDTASISVDGLDSFLNGKPKQKPKMRCHYAVEFGSQKVETDDGSKRAANLREVFNSPFRPFVLATTSIGQEGLDFHAYCRRIVHWNLPGNPIDLEQREGRINRYKGLVIRQVVANKYRDQLVDFKGDVWDKLFELADMHERRAQQKCELVPYWHVETDDIKIERVIPFYPYSSDQAKLSKILKTLAVYRLAFGQPRQAELVEHLLEHEFEAEEMKRLLNDLMINLSPIKYRSKAIDS